MRNATFERRLKFFAFQIPFRGRGRSLPALLDSGRKSRFRIRRRGRVGGPGCHVLDDTEIARQWLYGRGKQFPRSVPASRGL